MKLRQVHIKKFKKDVQALEQGLPSLIKACDDWLATQKDRDEGNGVDTYWAKQNRDILETKLDKFRTDIADLYDFMAERGLRDVEATRS